MYNYISLAFCIICFCAALVQFFYVKRMRDENQKLRKENQELKERNYNR